MRTRLLIIALLIAPPIAARDAVSWKQQGPCGYDSRGAIKCDGLELKDFIKKRSNELVEEKLKERSQQQTPRSTTGQRQIPNTGQQRLSGLDQSQGSVQRRSNRDARNSRSNQRRPTNYGQRSNTAQRRSNGFTQRSDTEQRQPAELRRQIMSQRIELNNLRIQTEQMELKEQRRRLGKSKFR
jgi:hypothetical protein